MKLRTLFLIGFAAAATFVGCKEDEVTTPSISVEPATLTFGEDGETQSVTVVSTRDWVAEVPESAKEWVTVTPASGAATEGETVTVEVKANTGFEKSTKITFNATVASATLEIKQAGAPIQITTIKDFISKSVSEDVWYYLEGMITKIKNDTYGNLVIQDDTGTLDIQGLTATKQEGSNDKSFATLGLEVGDVVTICGIRSDYNDTPQAGSNSMPTYYVSHVPANEVEAAELNSIEDIFTTTELKVAVKGQVIAAGNVSFVINDGGEKNLYVYVNEDPGVAVGDNVKVTGTKTEYPDNVNDGVAIATKMIQIASPTIEKISDTFTPSQQPVKELSGQELASFSSQSTEYVKVNATVKIDGDYTNLNFDGEGGTGSVVSSSWDEKFTDGAELTITGYYGGRNARGYFNILPTDVAENTTPRLSVSTETLNVGAAAGITTFEIKSNVDWTVTSSDETNFSVDKKTGNGNAKITITYTANDSETERPAKITVETENAEVATKSFTINVTQKGKSAAVSGAVVIDVKSIESALGELGSNSYGNYSTEKTGTISDVEYAAMEICKNSKDGTLKIDAGQFIQIRKSTGYITNKTAKEIKSLKVYVVDKDKDPSDNEADIADTKITIGTDANPTTEAVYTTSTEKITATGDSYGSGPVELDVFVYDVTIAGAPTYFNIASSVAIWLYKIEVEY